MPKLNLDDQKQLAEPIEIVIDGIVYTIAKIPMSMINRVAEIAKDKSSESVIKQFCLLTGAEEAVVNEIDIRKIGKALDFVLNTVQEGISLKNE
jgi:hypothetical protein